MKMGLGWMQIREVNALRNEVPQGRKSFKSLKNIQISKLRFLKAGFNVFIVCCRRESQAARPGKMLLLTVGVRAYDIKA